MGGHFISNIQHFPCINYEHLLQTALDPIIVRDPTSAIIAWNQGATQLYGWSAQEALGQVTHTLLQTRFSTSQEEVDTQLCQHGHWKGLLYHTDRDGQQIIVESRQQLVRDEQGRPAAILEINRDITDHKRTEEALQFLAEVSRILSSSLDSTTTLQQVAECIVPLYADICLIDLLTADKSVQRIVQKRSLLAEYTTPTQPLHTFVLTFDDTHHPIIKVLQSGQPEIVLHIDEEWLHRAATSKDHYELMKATGPCSLLIAPLIADGKKLGTLTCCYTHASNRTYTEQELELLQELASRIASTLNNAQLYNEQVEARKQAEADQQFVSLVEHSTEFVAITTLDAQISYVNPAGRMLVGQQSLEEALTRPVTDYYPEQLQVYFSEVILPHLREQKRWEGDLQLQHFATGELIDVHQTFFIINNTQNGMPHCLATVAHDIREQKELDQRKDTFISMASHELRNPLTSIHANLQLAERHIQNILNDSASADISANIEQTMHDAHLSLRRALRQTKVMNRLIGDLLDGTRIQANKLNLSLYEYDIVAILQEAVQDQCEVTRQRIIQQEIANPGPIMVLVDKDRIGQVMNNYLTNALKYSASNKEVVVGLRLQGQNVHVWVTDKGPGLTPEQQEHIWDRYYQAKDIRIYNNTGVGLGLGLHICKMLVTRQGGQVGVDSTPGHGSTFWFTLPLAETLSDNE
jgi:PAS domain S-box-containing protein